MLRRITALVCLAIFALCAPAAALGQAVYGNIVGTVVDPSGAAVPNAKVTITDLNRSVVYNTTTNDSGNFSQRFLIAGNYQVRVEAGGFQASRVESLAVSVDQETRVDIKLQVGDVSQVIEVSAEAPLLKTERSDVAVTYSEKTVTNLPIINRRFTNLKSSRRA